MLTLARPLPSAVTVACLRGDAVVATPEVPRVTSDLRIPLRCPDADGLRLDFTPAATPDARVEAAELAGFRQLGTQQWPTA
ncbi:MAG: hypothetical protein EP329_06855, partial [Deltaproteobacteria bacterium]